jgi:hypothetical protein
MVKEIDRTLSRMMLENYDAGFEIVWNPKWFYIDLEL